MVTYPLNELQPGMIVAADVFTPRGQLIVLRGSILSQWIHRLPTTIMISTKS